MDEERAGQNSDSTSLAIRPISRPESAQVSDPAVFHGTEVPLRLEGPYYTPTNLEVYKTVVCLVAGTGLSGAIAIAEAFQAQRARPRLDPKAPAPTSGAACTMTAETSGRWDRCVVIWSVREKHHVDMPFLHGKHADRVVFYWKTS